VEKQIEDRARTQGITLEAAQHQLLSEKQPSLQFTTPQQVAELTTFLCSSTANNVRGVAWNIDGGWLAQ
jgi:3-hydroxybutyrate dehydrogenase